MPLFERERQAIDKKVDEAMMAAYDAGWNSVIDILNIIINEKHQAGDKIAVEVLAYARGRIAGVD